MDKTIVVALISAATSIITVLAIKPFVDKRLLRFQLKLTYKAEQTKKINDVIAEYKGRLLKSAEHLNNRLKNFSKNYNENWLTKNGDYLTNHHYLDTIVYRFLTFYAYIKIIEKKLIYFDTTISQKANLRLIKYFRVFHDAMCDVDLFTGFVYDKSHSTDHFFSNPFDSFSAYVIEDNEIMSFDVFLSKKPFILSSLTPIYTFFDGIKPQPMMLRCERLKIFHLALISFLNEYGYDFQKTSDVKIKEIKQRLGQYLLIKNFEHLVSKYKLNKWLCDPIKHVIKIK